MHQQSIPLAGGPRISRVTISRLYNLGSYEHVRYEVTVGLPPGTSPSSVVGELEGLLAGMNPKRPHSDYAVGRAIHALSKPEPKLEDFVPAEGEDTEPWGDSAETKLQRALREREEHRQVIAEYEQWRKDRDAALARFDALGGSLRHGGAGVDDSRED